MNRNSFSHFATNPTSLDMSRSTFRRDSGLKTSFNVGDLIPIFCDEVLPGDTFKMRTSFVARLQTLITPVMDNIYLDTYYFFVPNRLVWEHWRQFMGENTESAWIPQTEYSVPQIEAPSGGWNVGTIADYFGIPTGVDGISVNALPIRAYSLICNEWFRSENLTDPLVIPVSDSTVTGSNGNNYITDTAKGGAPFKAAKFMDYFTSALPSPQKGPDVSVPLGSFELPVVPRTDKPIDSTLIGTNEYTAIIGDTTTADYLIGFDKTGKQVDAHNTASTRTTKGAVINNQYAIGDSILGASINQLRLAFQIQKLYERDARGGTRYIEVLKSHFGVTSPDARMQRPEYLGGSRVPITINQVIQQSGTMSGSTPQGNVAGMSVTHDANHDFTHSFTEHGFVIGLAVARYDHTYQQGLQRFWSRSTRFDYYWPALANIGEMAIKNKEIYAQGTTDDDEVFGYQEAWADYRYKPSIVTGEMRSSYATSLDSWHLADDYAAMPYLSDVWIREDKANVDRVLAVQSSVSNQLFADFYFQLKASRCMPLYSVPGLIDHH